MDGGEGGSEPMWVHELVRHIAPHCAGITAITGDVVKGSLPANVRVLRAGLRPGQNLLTAVAAAQFTLRYGKLALAEFRRNPYDLVHHVLPFALGQTINPLVPFLGRTPLIIGPVQGAGTPARFGETFGEGGNERGRPTRRPFSARLHGIAGPLLGRINTHLLRRAAAVIAISEEGALQIRAALNERVQPIVIPVGIDTSAFVLRPRRHGEQIRLLSVCYLLRRKRVDLVMRTAQKLIQAGRDVALTIVGVGPEETALKILAGELGLGERVRFVGFVPNHEVNAIYATSDVFVSASEHETWGTVFLEALACGLPVATTTHIGSRAIVSAPERGRVVAQGDVAALAAAVLEIAPDRATLERRSHQARAEIIATYDWSVIGKRYADVYADVLERASTSV